MNKDCKVSIERDANGSLSVLLTGHKDDIRMLWTMTERSCCWMRPTALMARFFHCRRSSALASVFMGIIFSLQNNIEGWNSLYGNIIFKSLVFPVRSR